MFDPQARHAGALEARDRCRCTPTRSDRGNTQTWPLIYAHHHGHATYTFTLIHQAACGLPSQTLDPAQFR